MALSPDRIPNPVHAILLAGAFPLFLGVLLTDLAYASTYEVQWKNFASWLLVGGLVFSGFALLWGVLALLPAGRRDRWSIIQVVLLLIGWVVGFINALVHAMDAWASMPAGVILSIVALILITAAVWLGLRPPRVREL